MTVCTVQSPGAHRHVQVLHGLIQEISRRDAAIPEFSNDRSNRTGCTCVPRIFRNLCLLQLLQSQDAARCTLLQT
jgi:hypothetical protein